MTSPLQLAHMNHHEPPSRAAAFTIREITEQQHTEFLNSFPTASFLQNPRWSRVKEGWSGEVLGGFDGEELVAAAEVLYRRLPIVSHKVLAYVPEGPVFDPHTVDVENLLPSLVRYLRSSGAFLVRMGLPGTVRRWAAQDVRRSLSKGDETHIEQLEPLEHDAHASELHARLENMGWIAPQTSEDFEAGQPRYQARIPLTDSSVDDVLAKMDQTSRRQTRKSLRSELSITVGDESDLPAWHRLYSETAQRDGFTARPLAYFQRMYAELNAAADTECVVYFAAFEETTLAAAIYVRQRKFAWYVYGASSTQERKRYAPRALQLRQIEDALSSGCEWYDLGGVSPSLDSESPLAGLTRFKTTMGADVVKTLGEWDYRINWVLAKAFDFYMSRR